MKPTQPRATHCFNRQFTAMKQRSLFSYISFYYLKKKVLTRHMGHREFLEIELKHSPVLNELKNLVKKLKRHKHKTKRI